MTFRTACFATAVIWGLLAVTLTFLPGLIYWFFQIAPDPSASFLGRRAGMLFLGLATMMFVIRNATSPDAQRAASAAAIASMGGLAVLGIFEFMRGFAGAGIWIAIIIEVGLVVTFARYLKPQDR